MPWDEDYEVMEQLMAIVQKVRGTERKDWTSP